MSQVRRRPDGVLFDLLMAVMNSLDVWARAAGDRQTGLAWRDAATSRIRAAETYVPYEPLVAEAASDIGLAEHAAADLIERWGEMEPWPDVAAVADLPTPYGFVTNSSTRLARMAAERSGLTPRFVLSAEEIGRYKPHPDSYLAGCSRLGTRPARTLFVAGSPYDAQGAHEAGLRVVLIIRRADQTGGSRSITALRTLDELARGWG